jgi:hypothetical protein
MAKRQILKDLAKSLMARLREDSQAIEASSVTARMSRPDALSGGPDGELRRPARTQDRNGASEPKQSNDMPIAGPMPDHPTAAS